MIPLIEGNTVIAEGVIYFPIDFEDLTGWYHLN